MAKRLQNQGPLSETVWGLKKTANHHDTFFKSFFSDPKLAFELFKLVLTEEELQTFNWSGLNWRKTL